MRIKLPNLEYNPVRTKEGVRERYLVRVPGRKRVTITAEPGSDEFFEQYRAARAAAPLPVETPDSGRIVPGSLRDGIVRYYASGEFKGLDPRTQRIRRNTLDRLCERRNKRGERYGDQPLRALDAGKITAWRDESAIETGNALVKFLRQVFVVAVRERLANYNPARDVPYRKTGSEGFRPWGLEQVRQFEQRHAVGTKARLALALFLYLGQRRSDTARFGRQHLRSGDQLAPKLRKLHPGNWIAFTQFKNRKKKPVTLWLPVLPELQTIIDTSPCGDLTFLVTEFGNPFSDAGLGNWFRARCDEAGLQGYAAHGLRKCGATLAAERGASERQLMAIFGWRSGKQAVNYTRSASQKKLAGAAMQFLSTEQDEDDFATDDPADAEDVAKTTVK